MAGQGGGPPHVAGPGGSPPHVARLGGRGEREGGERKMENEREGER